MFFIAFFYFRSPLCNIERRMNFFNFSGTCLILTPLITTSCQHYFFCELYLFFCYSLFLFPQLFILEAHCKFLMRQCKKQLPATRLQPLDAVLILEILILMIVQTQSLC